MLREHIEWAKEAGRPYRLLILVFGSGCAGFPFLFVCFRYRGSDDENQKIMESG